MQLQQQQQHIKEPAVAYLPSIYENHHRPQAPVTVATRKPLSTYKLQGAQMHPVAATLVADSVCCRYCSAECQRTDWRQGGHKEACAAAAPVIEALTAALAAAPHPSSYQEAINPIAAAGRLVVREHQPNCLNCYHMVSSTVFCR